jgi:hypothetical protein
MKYSVRITERATNVVVETITCHSKRDADTILKGVQHNLNNVEFKAETVEEIDKPGYHCKICNTHLRVKEVCTIYCPNKYCKEHKS